MELQEKINRIEKLNSEVDINVAKVSSQLSKFKQWKLVKRSVAFKLCTTTLSLGTLIAPIIFALPSLAPQDFYHTEVIKYSSDGEIKRSTIIESEKKCDNDFIDINFSTVVENNIDTTSIVEYQDLSNYDDLVQQILNSDDITMENARDISFTLYKYSESELVTEEHNPTGIIRGIILGLYLQYPLLSIAPAIEKRLKIIEFDYLGQITEAYNAKKIAEKDYKKALKTIKRMIEVERILFNELEEYYNNPNQSVEYIAGIENLLNHKDEYLDKENAAKYEKYRIYH